MVPTYVRLRQALDARGMRQSELSELTGIGKSSISTYLSGAYLPKQKNLYSMAKALKVSESWLMGMDVPMEPPTAVTGPAAPEEESVTAKQTVTSDDELMAAFFHGADPSLTEEDLAAMWQDAKNFRDFIIAKKMQEKK